MTITLNTETAVDIDQLAAVALADDMEAKEAADKAKKSKEVLRKALEAQGRLNPDEKGTDLVHFTIKAPMVFDPKKAMQLLNADEIAACSALSATLVKKNIAPVAYELMQSPGTISLGLTVQS